MWCVKTARNALRRRGVIATKRIGCSLKSTALLLLTLWSWSAKIRAIRERASISTSLDVCGMFCENEGCAFEDFARCSSFAAKIACLSFSEPWGLASAWTVTRSLLLIGGLYTAYDQNTFVNVSSFGALDVPSIESACVITLRTISARIQRDVIRSPFRALPCSTALYVYTSGDRGVTPCALPSTSSRSRRSASE